jgi:hypothetical protein
VAHYLAIRFPICLALNKIDAFPDSLAFEEGAMVGSEARGKDGGRGIVRLCQTQAIERGELAVPVSAFAETWEILKHANMQAHTPAGKEAASPGQLLSCGPCTALASNSRSKEDIGGSTGVAGSNGHNEDDGGGVEAAKREVKAFFPPEGSLQWTKNEAVLERVKSIWKTTGTHTTLPYVPYALITNAATEHFRSPRCQIFFVPVITARCCCMLNGSMSISSDSLVN